MAPLVIESQLFFTPTRKQLVPRERASPSLSHAQSSKILFVEDVVPNAKFYEDFALSLTIWLEHMTNLWSSKPYRARRGD